MTRLLIVLVVFVIYTLLFKRAAGSLSLKKLSMISFAYYLVLVFCFIGASLVFLGFRDHYLIMKVKERYIDRTYLLMAYTLIAFPLVISFINKIFGISNMRKAYSEKIAEKIEYSKNSDVVWASIAGLGILCILSMIYVFCKIGYFPLAKLFYFDASEIAINRIKISKGFTGNIYIKNIIMLGLTPILSYIAYIYMRLSKEMKWKLLFSVLFLCSLVTKLHNFEKSPVIYYIFYFYILEILMGNVKNIKGLLVIGITATGIILALYYLIMGYKESVFSLSVGPGGRIFMTQIATLFLHIQAFPDMNPYLEGASLPGLYGKVLGLDESWVRSGRVVMELFNPSGVKNGTAGVMNTIFVGEAYANWGLLGAALAPVCVGFLYSFITCCFLRQGKTPLTIVFYLIIFMSFSQILLGGFVDYLYPLQAAIMGTLLLGVSIFKNRGKVRYMVSRW